MRKKVYAAAGKKVPAKNNDLKSKPCSWGKDRKRRPFRWSRIGNVCGSHREGTVPKFEVIWGRGHRTGTMCGRTLEMQIYTYRHFKNHEVGFAQITLYFFNPTSWKKLKTLLTVQNNFQLSSKIKEQNFALKTSEKSLGSTKPNAVERQTFISYCFTKFLVWETINKTQFNYSTKTKLNCCFLREVRKAKNSATASNNMNANPISRLQFHKYVLDRKK